MGMKGLKCPVFALPLGKHGSMVKFLTGIGVGIGLGLVVAGGAAAEDRVALAPEVGEVFWVQERPLSGLVSSDVATQDRRFFGGLGYGVNLAPPRDLALDTGAAGLAGPSGQVSLSHWHFGVDVLQPS